MIEIAAKAHNIDLRLPFDQLTQKAQNMFLHGDYPVDASPPPKVPKPIPRHPRLSQAQSRRSHLRPLP